MEELKLRAVELENKLTAIEYSVIHFQLGNSNTANQNQSQVEQRDLQVIAKFKSLQSHVMSLRVQYTNFTRTSTSLQHFQSGDSKWSDVIGGMRTKAEQRWNRLMDLVVSLEDSLWDRIAYYGKKEGSSVKRLSFLVHFWRKEDEASNQLDISSISHCSTSKNSNQMGVRLDFAKEFELALEQEKEKEEKIKQADREQSELIKIKETRIYTSQIVPNLPNPTTQSKPIEQNDSYSASNTTANSHQWNNSHFEHDRNVSQRSNYRQNGAAIDLLTPPKIDKCLQVNFTVPAHSAYLSQSGCVNITCSHCKCVIELPEEFIVNLEHARNATKITNPKGENRPNFTTESKLNESNISRVSTAHQNQLKNATSTKLYDSYSGENVVEQSNSKLPVKSEKTLDEVKEKSQNESIPSNNTLNDSTNTTKSQNLDVSEASNSQEKQRTKLYKDYLKQIKGREYKSIHEIMKEIDSKVKEEQHNMSVLSTRRNKSTKTEDAQNQTAPKLDLNKNQTQAIDSEVQKAENLKSGMDRGAGNFNEQNENFGENKTISHSNSLQKQSLVFTHSHVLNNFPIPKTVPSMENCENKENSAQKTSNTENQTQKLEPEKWNASDYVNVNKVKNSSDIICAPTVNSEVNLTRKKLDEGYIYSNDVTAPPIEVNKSQFHQSETQIPRIKQNGPYVENAAHLEIDNQNQENWNKKYRNQEKRNQENGTQGNQNFNPDNQNQGYKIYENCNQENRNQENRNQENRNQENRNQENRNQENRNQENCKQESSIQDSETTQPIDCLNDEEITRLTINGFITSTPRLGNNDNQNDDTLVKTNDCNPQTAQNGNVSILELEKLAPQEVYVSSFRLKMQQTNRKPLPENSQHINESND